MYGILGIVLSCLYMAICRILLSTGKDNRFLWQLRFEELHSWKKDDLLVSGLGLAAGICGFLMYGGVSEGYLWYELLVLPLIPLAVIDGREHLVPDSILIVWAVLAVGIKLYLQREGLIVSAIGCVVGGGIPGTAWLIRRDAIGPGDIKVLAVCGWILGFPAVLGLLVRALLVSGIYGVTLLVRKKASLHTELPFLPFLLIGSLLG